MKLRIGNTFNLKFTITSAGTPYDLRDKNLLLVVKNKIKNTEVILHCPAFSITGADHNVIFWTFQGNEQVYTGKYMLTLYENKGLDNMLAVDCCDAFELVNCTCDTDNETSCGNVEVETIELAADVLISGRMVQSDYSVTDPTDPAYIRNKPTLGTLAEKSVVDITDINATGTPSSSTTLHGDGTWKESEAGAANWGSIGGDMSSQTDLKNAFDSKVDNSRVLTDVPAGAVFTDTVTTINGKTGAITKADIVALGIPAQDTVYTHPTTPGNKHIPSGGSANQILRYSANGTAVWSNENDTTYSNATVSADGLMSKEDKSKLNNIESGANNYTLPADVVQDANYVHTDNNYTTTEKNKLAELSNYDDTAIINTLANKVDKVEGKQLSDENYSLSEKQKLEDLSNYDDSSILSELNNKVDNSRVLTDVPENAKFTDTTYSEITEAEINTGSASTLRTITARRVAFILGKVTTMINNAISALTKTDVGLSNVDNVKQIPLSQKGSNNGVAELDANGKVPANQLPSFVDDVLEFANLASFPQPGEADKIYVDKATNKTYRWGGSGYVQLNEGVVLGETITTAYRGDKGKIAYDHSQETHAPSNAQKNSDITKEEIEAKLTGNITSHSHSAYVPTSRTVAGKALTSNITLAKGDVGLGNVDNVQQASKTEFDSHNSDAVKHITAAERSSWNAKLDANKIVVVTALPASPDPNTFYFIEE